ncbi:M15 family metallopeptidase [Chromobacterium sp. IIBBL 290-4]|uniref:M15 family metallopeptidase n=1 Tax=Chromobacterium sp. IIBBL 290-4 TaxID=2953890 RepID=UPI0020B6AA56|nr:M15 family metallopeptidase [Chromobacterium sp. IIBBL 290-4]UTH76029.1 M15 family metallopeptidase [Chromobacterium sp. IIBBL 290-4]
MQPLAEAFLRRCRDHGLDPLLVCTWRSAAEQAWLYQFGRTLPGPILTHARPGESAHNAMLFGSPAAQAFDVVPLAAGKPVRYPDHPHWLLMADIGQDLGLHWHGHPESPWPELAHFELPPPEG